ncbi:DUF3516 domain-containing protein, partial [Micromonospora sp. NPDC005113]
RTTPAQIGVAARRHPEVVGAYTVSGEADALVSIGIGPDARGPALLMIEQGRERWTVRQIFDDPDGDHDWGISAEVDLAASDEIGAAVIRITDVGQL